jgi:hypothetical protein
MSHKKAKRLRKVRRDKMPEPGPSQPPLAPKEVHMLHISIFEDGKYGVSYPKDLAVAFTMLGEATKILAGQLQKQMAGAAKIEIPRLILPRDLRGGQQ